MTNAAFTECIVEEAALGWLDNLGFSIAHGPDIAPDTSAAERTAFNQVALDGRLRMALAQLNPALPPEALEDAFRKLTRPEGPTLETRNRAFHKMLIDGEKKRGVRSSLLTFTVEKARVGRHRSHIAERKARWLDPCESVIPVPFIM